MTLKSCQGTGGNASEKIKQAQQHLAAMKSSLIFLLFSPLKLESEQLTSMNLSKGWQIESQSPINGIAKNSQRIQDSLAGPK